MTMHCQRWRDGRDSYRPARETITPSKFEVASIPDDTTAKSFVQAHHYSGSYPAARFRHGLYRDGELVGVAVYSVPCNPRVLTNHLACERDAAAELGRFVLLDDVLANGETWFLARSFKLLKLEGLEGVIAFSDPLTRTTVEGDVVKPGHIGTIYQAHNGRCIGRSGKRTLRLLPSGRVFSARARSKIRSGARGWRYAVEQLVEEGAEPLDDPGDGRAWLKRWLPRLTRKLRHPGNYRYAWPLVRTRGLITTESQPYPKDVAMAA